MLPTQKRLKKDDFDLLKKTRNKTCSSKSFSLKIYDAGFNPSRFAVIIPASVYKKAVQRNKVKRRFKSVMQKHTKEFKNGFAVVVYPKKTEPESVFNKIEEELMVVFKKAGVLTE